MPTDDSAIGVLKDQVANLTQQLQALTSERDEYRDALDEISRERDVYREKLADPGEVARENAALKQQIRDRAHYDRFAELAREAGARQKALKTLWKIADHKAETDEPDDRVLGRLIDSLKAENDYAFEPAEDGQRQTVAATVTRGGLQMRDDNPRGPAAGRGERNRGGDGTLVTPEMRADPKFMLDAANQDVILAAAREHRFR